MVDFNNDSMISKPPIEIVNIIVIEHWYNWRLAWEFYMKHRLNNANVTLSDCRSRLALLFLSTVELLERKLEPDDFTNLYNICCVIDQKCNSEDILKGYLIINKVLDEAGLIKIDTKPYVNRQRIEEANRAAGY